MGVVLLVYVRLSLLHACGPPRTCSVGTGLLRSHGQQGAVACSLRVHTSTLCLICSHLASGASAVEARNLEYTQLMQRIAFDTTAQAQSGRDGGGGGGASSVLDHDYILWFGDLNYGSISTPKRHDTWPSAARLQTSSHFARTIS